MNSYEKFSHPDCLKNFSASMLFFLFYVGFLSQTFTNHKTAGERGGHFCNSSLPLPPASASYWPDSNREPLVSERKSQTTKLRALDGIAIDGSKIYLSIQKF